MGGRVLCKVPLDAIDVSEHNTRKDLSAGCEDSSISDLAHSLKTYGLQNPIQIVRTAGGRYAVIAGQRRFLAARHLGWREIDAFVEEEVDVRTATALSLIENVHRADMNAMDKARALQALVEMHGSRQVVVQQTGISGRTVDSYLALLRLPQPLQERISTSEGPAKVEAMATLAKKFQGEEAMDVYDRISGFRQDVMIEIVRRSEGRIEAIEGLVEQAQQGVFGLVRCGSSLSTCPHVPEKLRAAFLRMAAE